MKDRTILCPCEDVELREIHDAVERGYTDLEAVKRLTAVTTGPCQGTWCLKATLVALAEATDRDPGELGSISHRPPVDGVPLGALAGAPLPEDEGTEQTPGERRGPSPEGT